MDDTWASRDLPVLDVVVSQLDQLTRTNSYPEVIDIASSTGLEISDVTATLIALDSHYIELRRGLDPSRWHVVSVTFEARRAVGQWPTSENLIERLAAGICHAAEEEQDPEQKHRLTVVARELGGAAKAIAINVASEILEHRLPH